jgi:hypothetical protein
MLNKATYQIFHTDTGNKLRNDIYKNLVRQISFLPSLESETYYFDTFDKAEEFTKKNKKFTVQTLEGFDAIGQTFPSNSGILGIWAGTYMAYKKFLKTDKEYLFVLQDDIKLSPNFKGAIEAYMKELPNDWEIFSPFVPNDSLSSYKEGVHGIPDKNFICKSYQQWSTCCYVVNRAGAKKVVKDIETNGVSAPDDWYLFNFRMKPEFLTITFNTYTLKPAIYKPIKLVDSAASISTVLTMDQRPRG